ncbi:unnamed protein product [Caenorhabditis sp. 36 PRJEB53466]|nr:unnamed protein product [Caenorhabditis sp. 36 PRJEB53466]
MPYLDVTLKSNPNVRVTYFGLEISILIGLLFVFLLFLLISIPVYCGVKWCEERRRKRLPILRDNHQEL